MNLRVVSVDGHTPVAPADQAPPQLLWVEVDRLRVDDRYQRPLERRNWLAIRKIAEDFRWSRFAPVLVAPLAGGEFALIDGQHRAHAAAMCGFRSVPAMSVLIDRKGQADAFNFVNSATIRIDRHQMFKAALAAGEPWAERCDTVVAAAGCELMTANWSAEQKKAGQVFCTALIRSLVEKGHAKAVTAGLTALKADADGGGRSAHPFTWSSDVLFPWINALADVQGWSDRDLLRFLQGESLRGIVKAASALAGTAEFPKDKAKDLSLRAVTAKLRAHLRGGRHD